MESHYATQVDPERPNNSHSFVVQLVGSGKRVLELGAASGYVSEVLRSRGNHVTAVEYDATCAEELASRADEVLITDLDWLTFVNDLRGKTFDVIVAGDVLEHTTRADLILRQLRYLLAPNGYVVVTLPHIAHGDVRLALLDGRFPYSDTGLLDRTHLRFFTRELVREFFVSNGFEIGEMYGTTAPLGTTELGIDLTTYPSEIVRTIMEAPDSDVYQFVVKALPAELLPGHPSLDDSSQPVPTSPESLVSELVALRQTLTDTQNEARLLRNSLARLEDENRTLQAEGLHSRDSYLGVLAELGEYKARVLVAEENREETMERLVNEMTRAFTAETRLVEIDEELRRAVLVRQELKSVYNSRAWRVGRLATSPMRAIKKLLS